MKAIPETDFYARGYLVHHLHDDFDREVDTTNWYTATLTDSGTATVASASPGILPLVPSDGSVADNDEAYIGLRNLNFSFEAGKPWRVYGRAQFAEANTSAANIALGVCSTVAANTLIDDGGGPVASGTHFCIFKVDGGTAWKCESRNGSTVYTNTSDTPAGGSAYFLWEVLVAELLTTHATVVFKVNGGILRDATTQLPIVHKVPYSGATALTPFGAVKNGSANLETLNLDYFGIDQVR